MRRFESFWGHPPQPLVIAAFTWKNIFRHDSVFAEQVRETIREKVDLEEAVLSHGAGQFEAMASEGTQEHQLLPPWATFIKETLNERGMVPNGRVADVFLSVPNVAVQAVLVRVRAALADQVAELIALTLGELPDKPTVMTGDRCVLNYHRPACFRRQHERRGCGRADGGGRRGGTAIGSQTASSANSSVMGTQEASGPGPA